MKVICINNSTFPELDMITIYTASQSPYYKDAYDIKEMLVDPIDGKRVCYVKHKFEPIVPKSISIKQYQEELTP